MKMQLALFETNCHKLVQLKQLKQLKKIVEDKLFQELLASVKQGAEITKGTMAPSRTFQFPETEVRILRERFGLSQDKFAPLVGISIRCKNLETCSRYIMCTFFSLAAISWPRFSACFHVSFCSSS